MVMPQYSTTFTLSYEKSEPEKLIQWALDIWFINRDKAIKLITIAKNMRNKSEKERLK